ncbi:tRNA synthetases class I, catalytic domain-containing protein [Spinellus fusiger]|nr:tRNA synthetases class I, catalytic domain-containing protein [Spinellus fusiger]
MSFQLTVASKASPISHGVLAVAAHINALQPSAVAVEYFDGKTLESEKGAAAAVKYNGESYTTTNAIARLFGRVYPESALYNTKDPIISTLVDQWLDIAESKLATSDFKVLDSIFKELNKHLTLRSYIVGYQLTLADFVVWGALRGSPVFARIVKTKKESLGVYLGRWYDHIGTLAATESAIAGLQKQEKVKAKSNEQGKFDIGLTDAVMGSIVTRFPPEPSGYLHIGHAKAALLNQYFADTYNGKLIIRFDDTNPSKEKTEFEESIKEDLALIGVTSTYVSHTSDFFDQIYELALQLIKQGDAYCDDTDMETMRDERIRCVASKCRDASVEENLANFEKMKSATTEGLKYCLRAKICYDSTNGTLRDPVIYRCNVTPHHHTGDKWKIYPTYDFACPIVDSVEGVTHALRTNEYRDRNPQYHWMIEKLALRKVNIWDFSRVNFVYTLLSKRKLQWFVDNNHVTGWDDPRFPTVRGIRRRGMTIPALKEYILMQGASQNSLMLEWDKLWAMNKKVIDPVAPRHTAVVKEGVVHCTISGAPATPEGKQALRHKKNPAIGMKTTTYSNKIILEQEDAKTLEIGEELTLMDWGNVFVRKIEKDESGHVSHIDFELHLEGDFKKTKKKITWLSFGEELVDAVLVDYDYLINKKKVEEGDDLKDLITPVTEFKTFAIADANIKDLKKGDIIQFERKGYYILDAEATADTPAIFILIPDGKAASIASKADDNKKTENKKAEKPKKEKADKAKK